MFPIDPDGVGELTLREVSGHPLPETAVISSGGA
jgi:hypothetical protein